MTITTNVASKLFVGFVAIAMALTLVAPVQAATEAELQAQYDELMATLNGLQAQLGIATEAEGGSSASVCPYVWSRSLSTGSTGADVMALQQFLNADANTMVAATGVGSAGMETDYYGGLTAAAVSNFQVMYRDDILTPVGLVNPTGYFGPSTMAKANALCASAPAMDDTMDDAADDAADDADDTMDDVSDLSGEGTLATLDLDDDEDEVQEGAEDAVVAILTLEAEDGDVLLDRITFTLTDPTTGGSDDNEEGDPWDVFDEVSLWVDGDKVADFEADDEDNFLDEDAGEFRFSKVNLILPEDEEVEVLVAVSVAGSVDGSDDTVNDVSDWAISPTEVRYFDADDVATNEDGTWQDLGESEVFEVVEEGTDDAAEVEANSDNPDAANLQVEDNSSDSDEYTVFIFDIEVDEDSSDLVLEDAFVDLAVTVPAGGVTTTVDKVVSEIFMTIDGEKVEGDYSVTAEETQADADIDGFAGATSADITYRFEFDELDLKADTDYEVEVSMVFDGQDSDGEYDNGVQIDLDVDGSAWEVEGLASDNVLTGTEASETHTLSNAVPTISDVSDGDATADDPNDSGTISFEFTVGADGDNDVTIDVNDNDDVATSSDEVDYTVTGPNPMIATGALAKVSGDATYSSGTWTISDGDEATFALDVTFTTAASTTDNGTYRVTLDSVGGVEIDQTSDPLALSTDD